MKFLVHIVVLLISVTFKTFSQEDFKDTAWFNSSWNICPVKSAATFYRVYKKADKGFFVYDKYIDGKIERTAEASAVSPVLIKNGQAIYYNENGTKSSRGVYRENIKIGIWIEYFDNEKDSSIYEVAENTTIKYFRKSALQKEEVFTIVEKQAEFPGGIQALIKFIQSNLAYPTKCRELGVGGKVLIKFVINETGFVDNVSVVKSSCVGELDAEAERIIKQMPNWKPAEIADKKVKCYFHLPISFKLEGPTYLFDQENTGDLFLRVKNEILTGNDRNLYRFLKDTISSVNDFDVVYNYAVNCLFNKRRFEACESFSRINAAKTIDESKLIKKQTAEQLDKFCSR